jgi:hypothetical protein
MGGLGIVNPTKNAPEQLQASVEISQPLSDAIIEQKPYDRVVTSQQHQAKTRI